MKSLERLENRLIKAGIMDESDTIDIWRRPPYAAQMGYWAWEIVDSTGRLREIGSEDAMTQCLRAKRLSTYKDKYGSINVCAEFD